MTWSFWLGIMEKPYISSGFTFPPFFHPDSKIWENCPSPVPFYPLSPLRKSNVDLPLEREFIPYMPPPAETAKHSGSDAISTPAELRLTRGFADVMITPSNLTTDLGKRHVKIDSLKELAYLHPTYFQPEKTILGRLRIGELEDFIVLRLNAFDATHDFGTRGFGLQERRRLVGELSKHGRVFISSEGSVSEDLSEYGLRTPKEQIHHVLHYAKMLIADTGTMVTEAAILGTPAICYHPKARKIGNFVELEEKYQLILTFTDHRALIEKAVELLTQRDLKRVWKGKQEKLIHEKIDIVRFMTWFIENYPESHRTMQKDPTYSKRFV
jgi:predicted glycosyltransferase